MVFPSASAGIAPPFNQTFYCDRKTPYLVDLRQQRKWYWLTFNSITSAVTTVRNCRIKQCTKHALSSSPVAVSHWLKMVSVLPITLVLLLVTRGQSQQGHPKCGSSDCVIISSCPSFLKLVTQVIFAPIHFWSMWNCFSLNKDPILFQMKSGSHAAKRKVMSSQCGFERFLPKVCCHKEIGSNETPRTTKSPILENKPTPAALVQTTKQTYSLIRRVPNALLGTKKGLFSLVAIFCETRTNFSSNPFWLWPDKCVLYPNCEWPTHRDKRLALDCSSWLQGSKVREDFLSLWSKFDHK